MPFFSEPLQVLGGNTCQVIWPVWFEVFVPQRRGSYPAVQQVPVVPVIQVWVKKRQQNKANTHNFVVLLGLQHFFVGCSWVLDANKTL